MNRKQAEGATLNERITYVREQFYGKRSKSRFAEAIGIPITTYVEYEKDRKVPADVVDRICQLTGARWKWLTRGEGPVTEEEARRELARKLPIAQAEQLEGMPGVDFDELRAEETTALPLMGSIVAGDPVEAEEWDRIQYARVLTHHNTPTRNRYVLRVQGESMVPELKPEDLVLIENRDDLRITDVQGRICAVMVNGEATLKRVRRPESGRRNVMVELVPENPEMSVIEVGEGDEFRILGVAIEVVGRKL